jgi:hypothetical protein
LKDKGLKLIGEYDTKIKKQTLECLSCGHRIDRGVRDVLYNDAHTGCPECRYATTNQFLKKERLTKTMIGRHLKKLKSLNFGDVSISSEHIHAICENGHSNSFEIRPNSKHIHCEECIEKICVDKSMTIIGRNDSKLTMKCSEDHEWVSDHNKLLSGDCCVLCNHGKVIGIRWTPTDEQYKELLKRQGFIVDPSEVIISCDKDVKMRCVEGHEIHVPPVRILRNVNYRCGKCSNRWKLTYGDICERLEGREITLLDHTPPNTNDKAEFKCGVCDFIWSTKLDSVINSRSGCPSCCVRGFNQGKDGFFYIHRVTHQSGKRGLKIGVSHNVSKRKKIQQKSSDVEIEHLFSVKSTGSNIATLEKKIKQDYKEHLRFFSKNELKDGYTESVDEKYYNDIVNDVQSFLSDV